MSVQVHAGTTRQAEIYTAELVQFLVKFGLFAELRKSGSVLIAIGGRELLRVRHEKGDGCGTYQIELLELAQQVKTELGSTLNVTAGSA